MPLKSQIESILFISIKPLSDSKLAALVGKKTAEVRETLDELAVEYNQSKEKGIQILKNGNEYQMATSSENAKLVSEYIKDETSGELTRPSLETLTIVAYREPISKAELEQIRGVNCSLILRNLLIRGLIEANEDKKRMQTLYSVSMDFLKFLGVHSVAELPEYARLSSSQILEDIIKSTEAVSETQSS